MRHVLTLLRRHAIAFAALFLLLGTSAYAVVDQVATPASSSKKLYACLAGGWRTLNYTTAGATCPNGQRKISWDVNGKTGARGPAGKAGPQGETGATGPQGAAGATGAQGAKGDTGAKGETGAAGAKGDTGAAGATGPQGAKGDTGDTGPQGPAGTNGTNGTNGSQGPAGPPGPQGTPGESAPARYGRIYNTAAQVVAIEADVLFDSNGVLSGLTHAAGTSQVVVTNAGTYDVRFSVSGVEPNQFALVVNGSVAPGTTFGSGAGTQQNTGEAILTLSAGDVLTLRNHSSAAAVTLQTLAGGTQNSVNASLTIQALPSP